MRTEITFYKDGDNWYFDNQIVSPTTFEIRIRNNGNGHVELIGDNNEPIFSGFTTSIKDKLGNGYADFAALVTAVGDFFVKASEQAYWASVAEAIHSYGIIIDDNLSSPDRVQRIGNMELHRTLPLHQWKNGLFDADGNVNYYCHPQNTALKEDGVTAAVLDGTDGDVMSERMGFYVKFREVGDKQTEFRCSGTQIPGYSWIPRGLLGVYEASLNRLTGQMRSVMNFTPTYRGGNNNAAWDAADNTLLGCAVSTQNLTQFRTASRIGRNNQWSPISYFERWIRTYMYWVEYANTNSQAAVVGRNPVTGFMEGGLGNGVTTANITEWSNFNGANPFVPIGITNTLGNGSGEVSYVATNFGGAGQNRTFTPNRYRGVENPFGHIWEWHDGILIDVKTDASGGTSSLFTCNDPSKFSSTITADYTFKGLLPRTEDFIREMRHGEIMPSRVGSGAGSTTFYCDRFWRNIDSNATRGVIFGGLASDGSNAGLVRASTSYVPSSAHAPIGSRLCFLDA